MSEIQDAISVHHNGHIEYKKRKYRCALGKGGITTDKVEGDRCTPAGCFPIREVLYREDRLGEPASPFVTKKITRQDVWCEDSSERFYNQRTTVDKTETTDRLWREDHLYDVVAVLGYNDNPVVPGKGSAIFLHVARDGYTPTAGCISLSLEDLLQLLAEITTETQVCILEPAL